MSITSSNAPKSSKSKDNENGKETKDSNENKKKDRKINGGSKSFDELEDEGESDRETGSIDVGGYGTKRDGRNEKDYRAALKRRMVAYRWLITVKQTRKISADVDIKLILAGKVVLPEEILRDKPKNIDFERLKWDTIAFEENEINKTGAELLENL
ncbi:uncharacterized protein LOC134815093 [Bolinopsis microptera]|uniref:uncharacterized protein LOC134815093 n=1 Tax=Bolinopsis microptera TaxID=2820187 RepID=UPI00307A3193